MFKKTWDGQHFLAIAGSHSTKGARNGRVDVLPPSAHDATYWDAESRRAAIQARIREVELDRRQIRERQANSAQQFNVAVGYLKSFGPQGLNKFPREIIAAAIRDSELYRELKALQAESGKLRRFCSDGRGADSDGSIPQLFMSVAEVVLDKDTFEKIHDEAKRRQTIRKPINVIRPGTVRMVNGAKVRVRT